MATTRHNKAQKQGFLVAFLLLAVTGWADGAVAGSGNVNEAPSAGARNALGSFLVEPGFRVELVAGEPMIGAPVALAFDENGRLFVVERFDSTAIGANTGRVRLLENPNGEGFFQSSTIYADNLSLPSAVACYAGGVFVACGSEIRYFKDTRRDGVADIDKVVLSGFGGTNAPGPATALNNFNWSLDNRIHGATAGLGGLIAAADGAGTPVSIVGGDFAFDPRTLAIFPEAGPAQSGLSFDNWGNKFVCDWARPLRRPIYEPRYAARNPFFPRAPLLLDAASPATAVYHFSQVLERRPPGAGTNGLVASWLTKSGGGVVYRGSAFPSNYLGNVFIAAPEAHAIHRLVLRDNGLAITAERAPEERNTEFLVSKEPAFRPVQALNGPDGALYVADAQEGRDRGRIYRIVPEKFQRPPSPQLGKAGTRDLVLALAGNNGWHRDTAARLLFERHDPAAVPLLADTLAHSRLPLARLHALAALDGAEALAETHLLKALQDTDAHVRELAVRLCEKQSSNGRISDALWRQLRPLAADPALRVRYQLAFTLGEIRRPEKALVLAGILNRDLGNPWMQTAVLSSLAEGAPDLLTVLATDARFSASVAGREFLRQLALMIGVRGFQREVGQVVDFIAQDTLDRTLACGLLAALGEGVHRTQSSLALVDPQGRLQAFYTQALAMAMGTAATESALIEAIRLLGVSPLTFADVGDWLLIQCNPQSYGYGAQRSAAIATLGRYNDPGVVTGLLDRWPALGPDLRHQAVTALLSRSSRIASVLDAVEARKIAGADFSGWQLNFLRTYHEAATSARAVRLFGPAPVRRPEVVEQFKPALRTRGVAERGRMLFQARCAACHQPAGAGPALGPDLTNARVKGREKLLTAILEPSAEVPAAYTTSVIETKTGENLVGIATDDTLATVTLRQPGGVVEVWPRLNVQSLQSQPWSLMPDGLEQGLAVQDMADLLDYLMSASAPR